MIRSPGNSHLSNYTWQPNPNPNTNPTNSLKACFHSRTRLCSCSSCLSCFLFELLLMKITVLTRRRRNSWSKSISYSASGLVSAQMGDRLAGIPSRRRNKHPGLLNVARNFRRATQTENSNSSNSEPYGTPTTGAHWPFTCRNALIHFNILPPIPTCCNHTKRHVFSKF